jgi:hypothetical protein
MDTFHQTVVRSADPGGAPTARSVRSDVLTSSTSSLSLALGGDGVVNTEGWARCPCPAHNGTRPSLSIRLEGLHKLHVRCWSLHCPPLSVLRVVDERLGTRFAAARAAEGFTVIGADMVDTLQPTLPEPQPPNTCDPETR